MTIQSLGPASEHLYQYMVASADMYYAEMEQRDILVSDDRHGHLQMWGQDTSGDPATKVGLCQVLLEYGLYCCCSRNETEARIQMEKFGEEIGHQTARYLKANPHLLGAGHPAVRAVEQVLGSLGAHTSAKITKSSARIVVTECPVENTAKCCGLTDIELAHCGMNALCRALVADISPKTILGMSPEIGPEFILSLTPA